MAELLVSASTGAMGSLLEKLGTMLSDEYKLLKGVRDDIKSLKAELEAMQVFLIVMAEEEKPDKQAKLRADAVREMSYEIEDNIDKFMVLLEHEPSSKSDVFGNLKQIVKKIKDIKIRHKIAKDVEDIKSKVKEISERNARYENKQSSKSQKAKVDPRIVAVNKYATKLVGIDVPTDELLKWLSDKEGKSAHQLKVVSIVGCGGLGKTTLAKQVYDKLEANFECRAFVSISRNPDMTRILSSIFSQIQNKQETYAGCPELIIDWIQDFLGDKRYFIIIDDVWDIQTWETLDCALAKNGCGSVIMTTTRMNNVAKSCCSSLGDRVTHVHEMKPLGDADSKKLFFKRIFGCEENCPPNLKEVSESIIKKCGGLPLAINAISSLLAMEKTKEEWGRVRSSIGFGQAENSEIQVMDYILSLSYIDLPLYLRSCLLYLTLFPEDYEIERQRLVHRWISEGFIHSKDGQDLVELGETYFHELVNRSLIQPIDIGRDGKARRCRVHDTILDFLLYKSTEENFCTMLSNHSKPDSRDSRVRRFCLMGNEDQGSVEQLDLSHARSLGAFGVTREYLPSLAKSNALRVLDLCWCHELGNHHVKDIGRLRQLRYLNISYTGITELPGEIENLKYLETLDASCSIRLELPKSVTRLKRLARLFVYRRTILPDGIGDMENLQELGDGVYIFMQSLNFLEELGKLKNLRKLSIIWSSSVESDEECYKEKKLSIVLSLRKLDKCKLRDLCISFELTEKDATFIAHPFFPALNSIRQIGLWRGKLCWISEWMLSLVNLETLCINGAEDIEQQDVEMVGSIPTLLQFSLYCSCRGPIIISGGFQQLQMLIIGWGAEKWMFEAGAMPNLKDLELNTSKLRIDDLGIQHLSSLASLRVGIECCGVTIEDVEAAEVALKSMLHALPNPPAFQIIRMGSNLILYKSGDGVPIPRCFPRLD